VSPHGSQETVFERIRSNAAEVTRRARFVRIDRDELQLFAAELAAEKGGAEDLDPAHAFTSDDATRLAFTLLLDAINFGSGWFPVLRKPKGLSGYRTVASACRKRFEAMGSPSAAELRKTSPEFMCDLLSQPTDDPEVMELMALFARSWRDFGEWLGARHGDRFESVVEEAECSAARLVSSLGEMPLYRDVSQYEELDVPFYKRAQITVADLCRAFPDGRLGRFEDLGQLTLFADNLVPHVLRCRGVLFYEEELVARIGRGELLGMGSREEVEIRAVAVQAVEELVRALTALGQTTSAHELDGLLWNAGQAREIKATPRHRTRCSFY
jgi:hypothetical protein